ncbi:putative NADPH-dependent quinone reductase tdiC [Colletotrichum sidae]|uniref:Putative NADPH-dependent quinone reductase tdiC n=1 Tax=Colletotrichum sidae TaxID=1347389 RepID=A0A4R8TE77_9PEZI|nr:putative NADPH-dependent quinone reductase tdiC [Colletotrichum sidae]
MHAATVTAWGSPPKYVTVPDLPEPSPSQIRLRVLATGVHQLVRSRASGEHYSGTTLPHTPGVDGVGEDPSTGTRYYFFNFHTGSFSEFVNIERHAVKQLPDGADPVTAAAFMNPIMSSWMALAARTESLTPGFSVAILGATSASGRVAVDVVRQRGAGRVVGIARNAAALAEMPLDDRIVLSDKTDWSVLGEVDVVLDYVYGPAALSLLSALSQSDKDVQYVQIGSVSGDAEFNLPSSILRSKRVTLRGTGLGSWTIQEYGRELGDMVRLAAKLEKKGVQIAGLKDVETAWSQAKLGSKRLVFVSDELA